MNRLASPGPWILVALTITSALAISATADEPRLVNAAGVAVKGYDVVAYFDEGRAVRGSREHEVVWSGARWRFATAEHARAFEADPQGYAPQYGGYCAWAMADGRKATIDPQAWDVVDGKLYLNYSKAIQRQWREDVPGFIERAGGHWAELTAAGNDGGTE